MQHLHFFQICIIFHNGTPVVIILLYKGESIHTSLDKLQMDLFLNKLAILLALFAAIILLLIVYITTVVYVLFFLPTPLNFSYGVFPTGSLIKILIVIVSLDFFGGIFLAFKSLPGANGLAT